MGYVRSILTLSSMLPWLCAAAQQTAMIDADAMPRQWQYTEAYTQTLPPDDDWWKGFNDPVLDSLIVLATQNNYDVSMAMRRIEMARQNLRTVNSQYFPQISVNAGWNKARTSGATTAHEMPPSTVSYFSLGADFSWQVDVFGKVSARAKAGEAAFKASRAEYDAMMVTVCSKMATAYMQLRALQAQMDVLDAHIAQQKRVMDITQARHEAGLASMLDVSQARTNYYSTLAQSSSLTTSIAETVNGIAVLAGVFPDKIAPYLDAHAPLPDYHRIIATGVPMELLRRRPDIAQAEYTLAQYAAQLGVAKKDFLPTLTLSGSIGTGAHALGDMFTDRSLTYSIAPTLSWTVFDGLARNAAVASAREQMMYGIDNYNNTVLTAVQEVENAMAEYVGDMEYITSIETVVSQAQEAFDLSLDMYKQGLSAFINVANAQITLLQYSNELVAARSQALTSLINLYQALGGGY